MMKDKYEISIWEDYITNPLLGDTHSSECRIATIGSNTMNTPSRAFESQLIENIDGTNQFSFKLYYSYIDTATGEKVDNPFIPLISNETKIKVLWKDKWYDFIVKSITEDSKGKSKTYSCVDLFINELGKNGFNLEFSDELENNQGTVQELAEKVLKNTDWTLDYNPSDRNQIIQQEREESVYEITGSEIQLSFSAYSDTNVKYTITSDDLILLYYSVVNNKSSYLQFYYSRNTFETETDSMLVNNGFCLSVDGAVWTQDDNYIYCSLEGVTILKFLANKIVSSRYRAKRLVRSQKIVYDPLVDKYVQVYNLLKDGKTRTVYGYTETVYNQPTLVNNLLVNANNFYSTAGWSGGELLFQLYPPYNADNPLDYSPSSFLRFSSGFYKNSGLQDSIQYIPNGIQYGERYLVRIKAQSHNSSANSPSGTYISNNLGITPMVYSYTLDENGNYVKGDNYFLGTFLEYDATNHWLNYELYCTKSLTKNAIVTENIGFFISLSKTIWIEDIQFFPKVYGASNLNDGTQVIIYPGDINTYSIAQTQYNYYLANQSVSNIDDLEYLYRDFTDWDESNLSIVYNPNFVQIRSINIKESNRYDILHTLAETFACKIKFTIEHKENGEIIRIDGVPQKKVSFHKELSNYTGIGFIYGVDLRSISRTIDSNTIVTKTIVTPNTNEYADGGFCSIAKSKENYSKENFILNFDYYIAHGLINASELNNDLYSTNSSSIGYYYYLNYYNSQYDKLTEELAVHSLDKTKREATLEVYKQFASSVQLEITELESKILQLTGLGSIDEVPVYIELNPNNTVVVNSYIQLQNLYSTLDYYIHQVELLEASINNLQTTINAKTSQQSTYINLANQKHLAFYKKYARFIQEGSWQSSDYSDNDLYYLDAVEVAYENARPKVSYNILVARLSELEEFKNKKFNLGDSGYVQDVDLFGYIDKGGIKTPYREQIMVNELTSYFDSPEKNEIKIQNYKTPFQDLFQNLFSHVNHFQFSSGPIMRAAKAFNSDGTINSDILQKTFDSDSTIKIRNNLFSIGTSGVINRDLSNARNRVTISNGRVYMTNDGGATWRAAITGDGISTQYLRAGTIDTNNIVLMDGNFPSFRWDSTGINAYQLGENSLSLRKFVRFDKYGIYGLNSDINTDYVPANEEDIWNTAQFGLTWKGFFLKNKIGDNVISISSEDDILVNDGTYDRIKIGRIGGTGTAASPYIYGIKINDGSGNAVMVTESNGTLWLKNRLNIGTDISKSKVGIGYLETVDSEHQREVFNANNNFIVYEDGHLKAKSGEFSGSVEITGGTILGQPISAFGGMISQTASIISDNGYVFYGETPSSITITASNATLCTWTKNGVTLSTTLPSLTIQNSDLVMGQMITITVTTNNNEYASFKIYKTQSVVAELSLNGGTWD